MNDAPSDDRNAATGSAPHRVLLIVGGGIAAYKSLEVVRRLREMGVATRAVLTRAGAEFVTPLSLSALTEDKVYTDLFSLTDENEMGHIELSRAADLILVCPATADLIAKMANGHADDLASTVLMATDAPVMLVPAMNVRMWSHPATKANMETLRQRGVRVVGPTSGAMACGEFGMGRLAEPLDIVAAVELYLTMHREKPATPWASLQLPLHGRRAIVTSGPTHEPIDPVRYIANRSSGKQGHAIAAALAALGAETTLITGPTAIRAPLGVITRYVESAADMHDAALKELPCDIAVCAAAVADWRVVSEAPEKLKKTSASLALDLQQNPDILADLSRKGAERPTIVVGFAAETENVVANAEAKRQAKGCDWIVANDVSPDTGTFGGQRNTVTVIDGDGHEAWPAMSKLDVAVRLARRIAVGFTGSGS